MVNIAMEAVGLLQELYDLRNTIDALLVRLFFVVLISQSLVTIPTMDDTAVLKTNFGYCILHYLVVSVGVDTNGVVML